MAVGGSLASFEHKIDEAKRWRKERASSELFDVFFSDFDVTSTSSAYETIGVLGRNGLQSQTIGLTVGAFRSRGGVLIPMCSK